MTNPFQRAASVGTDLLPREPLVLGAETANKIAFLRFWLPRGPTLRGDTTAERSRWFQKIKQDPQITQIQIVPKTRSLRHDARD
jgi:hypothetical protein